MKFSGAYKAATTVIQLNGALRRIGYELRKGGVSFYLVDYKRRSHKAAYGSWVQIKRNIWEMVFGER